MIINPLRMCRRDTLVILCVCLFPRYQLHNLFKSSGMIFWPPLSSWLHDELSMDKRNSNGFFSTRIVCRDSNNSKWLFSDAKMATVLESFHRYVVYLPCWYTWYNTRLLCVQCTCMCLCVSYARIEHWTHILYSDKFLNGANFYIIRKRATCAKIKTLRKFILNERVENYKFERVWRFTDGASSFV